MQSEGSSSFLYWDLGKLIVSRQQKEGWGQSVVEILAKDLQSEFDGVTSLSARNLWRMREFYLLYGETEKLPPLVAEIGWSHHVVIMEKCKTPEERTFYINMTKNFGWTKNVLNLQIENQTFQRTASAQTNFNTTLPPEKAAQALLAVKDEYTFDFLELSEQHTERELEQALIARIGRFLIEMGGLFSYIGSQYRLNIGGDDFYIDLLLFHRGLKSLVAIELKITDFKPEHSGQMQFYLTSLNKKMRLPDENPAIGIILCKSKNRTVVEYALANSNHPMGVASYRISPDLPQEYESQLPSPEQMQKLLQATDSDQVTGKIQQLKKKTKPKKPSPKKTKKTKTSKKSPIKKGKKA